VLPEKGPHLHRIAFPDVHPENSMRSDGMTMSRRKGAVLAAGLTTVMLGVAACGGGSGEAAGGDLQTVTMAVSPYVGLAPLYLGMEQGFFEDEGIDLQLTEVTSPQALLQAVVAGQYNLGFAVVPSAVTAASQGAPVRCVAPISGVVADDPKENATGILVREDSPITSPADLAGKKVAVSSLGGQQAMQTLQITDESGGDWHSIQLVPLGFGVMNTALAQGEVDAIATTSPFLQQGLAGGGRLLSWMEAELAAGFSGTCTVAHSPFVDEHPDLVAAYRRAIERSLDYSAQHVEDARAMLPEITGITADEAKATPLGVRYDSKLNIDSIETIQETMVKYGLLTAPIPMDDFVYYPPES
jgi:NitT/TauT family transport system substrate-binding protein